MTISFSVTKNTFKIRFQWYPGRKKDLSNIIFGFSLYCWLIPCTFVNKQAEGIILSNHSPRTVASDVW